MEEDVRKGQDQAPPPASKPVMVYDGSCDFCKFWVNRWQRSTADEVTYTPFQQLPEAFQGVTREQFKQSVYLITQYRRLHGAAAVFEVLALGGNDFWNRLYYNVVLADTVFEVGYKVVANNRDFFFWLTRIFYKDARSVDAHHTTPL